LFANNKLKKSAVKGGCVKMKKLLLIIVALGMIVPAVAVDLDFYGNLKLGAWWEIRERYYEDTISVDTVMWIDTTGATVIDTVGALTDSDSLPYTFCNLLPHGHFGAKFKSDQFGACVEIGLQKNIYEARLSSMTDTKILPRENVFVYMRKWYVEWYMHDMFTLLLGQDYSPVNYVPSNQGYYDDNSFANSGCVYGGRRPMIQFTAGNFAAEESGLGWEAKVAVINPDTSIMKFRNETRYPKVDMKIPKFEGSVGINMEVGIFGFNLGGAFGYNTFNSGTYSGNAIGGLPKDSCKIPIVCWIGAGAAGFKLGPVSLDYTCAGGQNLGAYGLYITNPWVWRGGMMPEVVEIFWPFHEEVLDTMGIPIDYELKNSTAFEMAFILKVKPVEWLGFEGGYGIIMADHSYWKYIERWPEDNIRAYYGNITFTVAEVLEFAPEFGQYLYGPLDGYGRITYGGLQTRFSF
jgi:hypothetical protein